MSRSLFEIAEVSETWENATEFKAHVSEWANRIGVTPTRIQIQSMTRKWASCSPNGVLTFSAELLKRPRCFGEAVMVHELIHLKVPNHGPVFKSLMRALLPDADVVLSQNGIES